MKKRLMVLTMAFIGIVLSVISCGGGGGVNANIRLVLPNDGRFYDTGIQAYSGRCNYTITLVILYQGVSGQAFSIVSRLSTSPFPQDVITSTYSIHAKTLTYHGVLWHVESVSGQQLILTTTTTIPKKNAVRLGFKES